MNGLIEQWGKVDNGTASRSWQPTVTFKIQFNYLPIINYIPMNNYSSGGVCTGIGIDNLTVKTAILQGYGLSSGDTSRYKIWTAKGF